MSGYSRTASSPQAGRDSTIPRFHMEAVEDPIASAKEGRPIFREEERVQIIQPGNPNSPVLRVEQEHIQKWPEHYKAFKDGLDFSTNGTPLEQWPFLRKMNVLELKAKGIHSVEQCANLSDLAVQGLGMGGRAIRDNAKAYLDDAEATKIVSQAIAAEERSAAKVAGLERQLEEMKELLTKLHNENMSMKNAPSPLMTHVPAMYDPLSNMAQAAPLPESGGSSLDNLPERRPRGRPPGSGRQEAAA